MPAIVGGCDGYNRAVQMANVDHAIAAPKNNPMVSEPMFSSFYERNMDTLRADANARREPVHGHVYAGLMDNMRYGGNE